MTSPTQEEEDEPSAHSEASGHSVSSGTASAVVEEKSGGTADRPVAPAERPVPAIAAAAAASVASVSAPNIGCPLLNDVKGVWVSGK